MQEIVVLSGKGGTGKTSITAAFAALARRSMLVDCDVDAANLHLVLRPTILAEEEFRAGQVAEIDYSRCSGCGKCAELCAFDAISANGRRWAIDPLACEGCGVCERFCPRGAIRMREPVCGQWFRSETPFGPMVHAQLKPAAENSGKLVSLLRKHARASADAAGIGLVLTDGPPGIGCPVIASLTGADHAVFVAEPTVSGVHDLQRAVALARHFGVPGSVLINKADLNAEKREQIVAFARESDLGLLGDVPWDGAVTRAQVSEKTLIEMDASPASAAVRTGWDRLVSRLGVVRPGRIPLKAV